MKLTVLSVGGSIISPDKVDYTFLASFAEMLSDYLENNKDDKLILVAGGGAPARVYQEALRKIKSDADPTDESIKFTGRILVAGGWKPGFSTDTDAVYLATRFGGKTIVNLSNIKKVYTDDPKKNPDAKPIDRISWEDFRKIVGDEWNPGLNAPFDPIASRLASEEGMTVIAADGRNIDNTRAILEEKPFEGTIIGA